MNIIKSRWIALAASTLATPVLADWTVVSQERFVHAFATWMWTNGQPVLEQQQTVVAPGFGPFVETAMVQFGSSPNIYARGFGDQASTLGTASINATGRAEGECKRGSTGSMSTGEGESLFETTIEIITATRVRLRGQVSSGTIGGAAVGESVSTVTLSPEGGAALLSIQSRYPQGPASAMVDESITLAPGMYTLEGRAYGACIGSTSTRITVGEFELTMDVDCYPDCDGDALLTLADFGCFQTKFALADPYADCNGDSVLNLADFGCFQTQFALGCP